MKKIFFFIIFYILLSSFIVAQPSITITKPENKTYTTSIGIPIEFTKSGTTATAELCRYSLDNGKNNVSIPDCDTTYNFNVDFDKSYNFTIWLINITSNEQSQKSIAFTVDRNITSSTGWIVFSTILIPLIFFLILLWLSVSMPKEHSSMKMAFFGFSFIVLVYIIHISRLAVAEYLKFSYLEDSVNLFLRVSIIFVMFIIFYLMVHFIKSMFEYMGRRTQQKLQ